MDVTKTYGALLVGAFFAFILTGVLTVQCAIYFTMYRKDIALSKALVGVVWSLDILHSTFICVALFNSFITHFGDETRVDHITWSIALSVAITATQTFLTQCFFAQRILKSSKYNWYITAPIVFLAFFRLVAACVSTAEMIKGHSYSGFTNTYPAWVFTTGLTLSSGVDILITASLCYYLREMRGRIGSGIMINVIDALTLYTLENALLTTLATIASLICWLTMPSNLIFLGLHFVISKLYANSLLASLNTRKRLRNMRGSLPRPWLPGTHSTPVLSTADFMNQTTNNSPLPSPLMDVYPASAKHNRKLEVIVEQTFTRSRDL